MLTLRAPLPSAARGTAVHRESRCGWCRAWAEGRHTCRSVRGGRLAGVTFGARVRCAELSRVRPWVSELRREKMLRRHTLVPVALTTLGRRYQAVKGEWTPVVQR